VLTEKPLMRLKQGHHFRYTKAIGAVPKWEGRGLQNLHSWVRFPPAPPKLPSLLLVFLMTFREQKKSAQNATGFFRPTAEVLHKSLRPDFNQRLLE
jgi:hypothetical protein